LEKSLKQEVENYKELVDEYHEEEIRKISRKLKEKVKVLDEKKEDLSFAYAELALIAHSYKKRRATTVYFKQAIKLNPKHKQILLLEREDRKSSKKEITNYFPPRDAIIELDKILKNENSEEDKEATLIKILHNINQCLSESQEDQECNSKIDDYIKQLEDIFDHKYEIREHYRYSNLGSIISQYSNPKIRKYSLYYFSVSKYIAKHLPPTESNLAFFRSINHTVNNLKKTITEQHDITWNENDIKEKGNEVLSRKDVHYSQEISSMISTIYDETRFLSHVKNDTNSIKYDIDQLKTVTEEVVSVGNKNSDILISNQKDLLSQERSINKLHALTHQAVNQSTLLRSNLASLKIELYQLIQKINQRLPNSIDLKKNILSAFSELDINKYNQYAQKLDEISKDNGSVEFIDELNKKHEE